MEFAFVPWHQMTQALNRQQLQHLLQMDPGRRFQHFIREAVWKCHIWGLECDDRWACLPAASDGQPAFLMWPAAELALHFRDHAGQGRWRDFRAAAFDRHDLLMNLLPRLDAAGVRAGIFFTDDSVGVSVAPSRILEAMRQVEHLWEDWVMVHD